ncbi:MAG: AgmX/PglI C-terminal domain-containing protein [Archangium sp.]|nr:AgmX/PglI C-terminal domain-containing protein [Archangium sp.]MDP3570233.1 AgmX/PglI C-terminal domain-containing protein [Archangium sp.]
MSTRRALRVALIQAGRIVEDRTFTGRAKITVGTDAKSTFLVPMAEVPVTTAVFDLTKQGTALLFDANTQGRVSLEGADAPLHAYVARATAHGSKLSLALPEDAKGRVSIGEVSLLFQFVEPPKTPVAAELPKGARGLVAQLDRSFIVILAVSIGAHFAGAGYLSSQPVPEEHDLTIEEMNVDRWASVLMPLPRPPKSSEPERPTVAEAPKPKNTEPTRPSTPLTAEALKKRVRTMGMMGVIGSHGDGQSGFGDILKDTGVMEISEALRGTQPGVAVASVEDATASQRKGDETGGTSEIEVLGTQGVKRVELREATAHPITSRMQTEKLVIDTPEVDERALTQWLNGRKGAIQSCYERELKRSPKLAGRLVIKFAITSRGRVSGVGFEEDSLRSAQVQQCISGLMRAWVLPFSPEDEVPVTMPFIFSAAN